MRRTGGCACGAIRFEVTGDFLGTGSCHCTDCQKASGGAPNYVAMVPRGALRLLSGNPRIFEREGDSGAVATRAFCGDCGTPLWSIPAGLPFIPIKFGAFDDCRDFALGMQIYVASAPPWHPIDAARPAFAKMPPAG